MKASIELSLRTREVYQLFQRKIDGDRLFIEAILHKFNIVINCCQRKEPQALLAHKQIEQLTQKLIKQFMNETSRFEQLLAKRKKFDSKKITIAVQFSPSITVTNPLAMKLVELIEVYDKLTAALKLLHLAGCFDEDGIYLENVKRIQKLANQSLSRIILS